MFSIKSLATATTALSLIASSHATYYPESTSNLAVYWGQGANQATLAEFCKDSPVEIVPVAFINRFTAQANGWVGDNYGNACWAGEYKAPGWPTTANYTPDNDKLYTTCQPVREGIPACQGSGKKVILSLGGAWSLVGSPYQLTGRDEGNALAEFLWGAYGTYDANSDYILAGNPRPLDGGLLGTDGTHIDIDGFDFDIEHAPTDGGEGYIACIKRLRELFTAKGLPNKQYMITGAPQCIYPDANMGSMIAGVQFDALFIQFYNSEQCAANNPGFNFDQWTEITGPSANAKLYIGLLGSPAASTAVNSTGGSYYVPTADAKALIQAYSMHEKFGGVMVWEATTATQNINSTTGQDYLDFIKEDCLPTYVPPTSTVTSSTVSITSLVFVPSSTSDLYSASITSTSSSSLSSSSSTSAGDIPSSTAISSSSSGTDVRSTDIPSPTYVSSSTGVSSSSSSMNVTSTDIPSSAYVPSLTDIPSSFSTLSTDLPSFTYVLSSTEGLTSSSTGASGTDIPSSTYAPVSTNISSSSSSTHSTDIPSCSASFTDSSSSYIVSPTIGASSSSSTSSTDSSTTPGGLPSPTKLSSSTYKPSSTDNGGFSSSTDVLTKPGDFSSPVPTSTGGGEGYPTASPSGQDYTTSTVYTTSAITVSHCPPTVTNCPTGLSYVTTVKVPLYTTVCSVSPNKTLAAPALTPYTTSTVYATNTYTITKCPTGVKCPAGYSSVTTETVALYTTICPVSNLPTGPSVDVAPTITNTEESVVTQASTKPGSTMTVYTSIVAAPLYPTGPSSVVEPLATGKSLASGYPAVSAPTYAAIVAGAVPSGAIPVAITEQYGSLAPPISNYDTSGGVRAGISGLMIAGVLAALALMI